MPVTAPPVAWFVGLTTLDVVHYAAAPGRNEKVTASKQEVAAGGPAANAARTVAALGVTTVLVTALGPEPTAQAAAADLTSAGVHVVDSAVAPGSFTLGVSSVLIDPDTGERSVVSGDGALTPAPAPSAAQLDNAVEQFGWPEVVLFDGHHPQIVEAVLAWLDVADTQPGRFRPLVVLDGGRWRPIFEKLLPRADVAALSEDFAIPEPDDGAAGADDGTNAALAALGLASVAAAAAGAGAGFGAPVSPTIEAALDAGARSVVVTHGPDPVDWVAGAGSGQEPVPEVKAVNTMGAGDVFHGALVAAIADGDGVPAAVKKAIALASERVQTGSLRDWLEGKAKAQRAGATKPDGAAVRSPQALDGNAKAAR